MNTLSSMFRLDGQVAIVTGASKGIGRAISLVFAEAGANVVLAARTLADLEVVVEEIHARGGYATAVACDVEQAADRERLVATAVTTYGTIHLLVNNAGGSGPNDALATSADEFNAVLARNVTQPFVLTGLAVPHMRAAGGGDVPPSSVAGGIRVSG